MFKSELYNFYQGKVEFKGPDPQRQIIVVQTGMGGMKLVNEAIKAEASIRSGYSMLLILEQYQVQVWT